jgi:hypothetical protein
MEGAKEAADEKLCRLMVFHSPGQEQGATITTSRALGGHPHFGVEQGFFLSSSYFFFLVRLGFEFRASRLQSRCSTS